MYLLSYQLSHSFCILQAQSCHKAVSSSPASLSACSHRRINPSLLVCLPCHDLPCKGQVLLSHDDLGSCRQSLQNICHPMCAGQAHVWSRVCQQPASWCMPDLQVLKGKFCQKHMPCTRLSARAPQQLCLRSGRLLAFCQTASWHHKIWQPRRTVRHLLTACRA